MTTYAVMRSRIADELVNDGDISTSQINNAIQSAIADYAGEQFWFNEAVGTFSTVSSQELYTSAALSDIPTIIKILSLRIANTGSYATYINGVSNDIIEDMQDGTLFGQPRFYSRFANKIRLYPIPDAVYSMKISYISTFTALSADADTNAWMTDGEEVIRQAAKKRLATDILSDDALAQRCAVMEDKAYDGLRMENRNRRSQQLMRTEIASPRTFNINNGW